MSNRIDCSVMSHVACEQPEAPSSTPAKNESSTLAESARQDAPLLASYDCVNDCASSVGVAALVEASVAGLGCVALPPACPAFIAAVPATILTACNEACRELEDR